MAPYTSAMSEAAAPYREWPAERDLRDRVACLWESCSPSSSPTSERVFPDGCIDIVWDGEAAFVAGPDTGPVLVDRRPGGVFAGVRFRPGRAPSLLGVPAVELLDRRVQLAELWGPVVAGSLAERLASAPSLAIVAETLAEEVRARAALAASSDPVVDALVALLDRPAPALGVVALASSELGVGERLLHRRCVTALGYGPKTLHRVLRFQRALRRSRTRPRLVDLAADAGYADQAHLARECRRMTGLGPSELFKTTPSWPY